MTSDRGNGGEKGEQSQEKFAFRRRESCNDKHSCIHAVSVSFFLSLPLLCFLRREAVILTGGRLAISSCVGITPQERITRRISGPEIIPSPSLSKIAKASRIRDAGIAMVTKERKSGDSWSKKDTWGRRASRGGRHVYPLSEDFLEDQQNLRRDGMKERKKRRIGECLERLTGTAYLTSSATSKRRTMPHTYKCTQALRAGSTVYLQRNGRTPRRSNERKEARERTKNSLCHNLFWKGPQ